MEELFDADISGRDFPRGKPDPMIFLAAAEELGLSPRGVLRDRGRRRAACRRPRRAGWRRSAWPASATSDMLTDAGADLVVTTLDDVSLRALVEGRLEERRAAEEIRRRHTERPPSVWTLVYDGFDPARQGLREALCCAGQRLLRHPRRAARGRRPTTSNYPGTYVAGLYNRLVSEVAGREVENEDLVNVPNWLPLRFRIAGGPWFDVAAAGVEEHRLELDMRHGTLTRSSDLAGRRRAADQRGAAPVRQPSRTSTWPVWRPSSRPRTGRAPSRSARAWTAGWSTRASSGTAT